jgi:hypothetical protein
VPANVPPAPTPELRSGTPAALAISAVEVREIMQRTAKKLDALDRRRLSAGKRADYDAARRFLSQAQAAVRENNVMLAKYSADKAETLADGLR